jgi:ferredoxin
MMVVDTSLCTGCANCTLVCPVQADTMDTATQKATIDPDLCIECYACMNVCPVGAISDKS